ncbi:DNA adenine methylase [Acidaminococcus massiliensis]|uniref:DNA adenine methylase n=1 Tax=Acidaminococcus massiliensis TaxID=1852375 RepID=UPI00248E40F5|nr:DNA adenine methylase [Acidaminococcus massiliensis]
MPATKSILRYPGGKTQLSKFVYHTIQLNNIPSPIYCEAFCGGSGIAITLLLSGKVDEIVLNDFDSAIYSIWNAVIKETDRFINKIQQTPITIDEWHRQHEIYNHLKNIRGYSFDLAYAAFFLNRTNRSGIIAGGPIGGMHQTSKYRLDCRSNIPALVQKIKNIAAYSSRIHLYSEDGIDFIENILPTYDKEKLFTYFDPPYYEQGQFLYKNGLTDTYHQQLATAIQSLEHHKWITTYDNVQRIKNFYEASTQFLYTLHYTANVKRHEEEVLFTNQYTKIESFDRVHLSPA